LSPQDAVASDVFKPLIEIWQTLKNNPKLLIEWYNQRWKKSFEGNKKEEYEKIKASYNFCPNGADLLFLSRSCYGGVIRFRQADGYMSTPCGVHQPISPESFAERVYKWRERTKNTTFLQKDYKFTMFMAKKGDLIYCDPPYSHSQSILYGAQSFDLKNLFDSIADCKKRGISVVLSIDGTKKSGDLVCDIAILKGLFEREIFVNCGQSMLKRFQMSGTTLGKEIVSDRLLLTY
jgi:DNA adenine methylase